LGAFPVKSRKNPIGRIQEEPQVSQALNSENNFNGVPYPMKKKEFSKFRTHHNELFKFQESYKSET
jgi:hypothetical protein